MLKTTLTALFSIALVLKAEAQVFAPEAGVAVAPKSVAISRQSVEARKTATDVQNAADTDTVENNEVFVPAKVNLKPEQTEPEKVYDNKIGKVSEFKIVNGKVQYADPNDRKILVYAENYKVEKGMDGLVRCSMRIYVLNDMVERLNSFGFKLIWPEISTSIQMQKVNQGVRTYNDIMLLGNGCMSMDKTPTIEVNRCRVKGKTQEQCADAVRWFRKDK